MLNVRKTKKFKLTSMMMVLGFACYSNVNAETFNFNPRPILDDAVVFGDSQSDDGNKFSFLFPGEWYFDKITKNDITPSKKGGTDYALAGAGVAELLAQTDSYIANLNGQTSKTPIIFFDGVNTASLIEVKKGALPTLFGQKVVRDNDYWENAPRLFAESLDKVNKAAGPENIFVVNIENFGKMPLSGYFPMMMASLYIWNPIGQTLAYQEWRHMDGAVNLSEVIPATITKYTIWPRFMVQVLYDYYSNLASQLEYDWNQIFVEELAKLPNAKDNIVYIDFFGLMTDVANHPEFYGIDNILATSCYFGISCNTLFPQSINDLVNDHSKTYLTSGFVHPSPTTYQLLADYMSSVYNAPLVNAVLLKQLYAQNQGNRSFLDAQFFNLNQLDVGEHHLILGANTSFVSGMDNFYSLKLGYAYKIDPNVLLGALLGVGLNNKFDKTDLHFKSNNISLTLFMQNSFLDNALELDSSLYFGRTKFDDIKRIITIGKGNYYEQGKTKANVQGLEIKGIYKFASESKVTPALFLGISHDRYQLKSYAEEGDRFSAMQYAKAKYNVTNGQVGARLIFNQDSFSGYFDVGYNQILNGNKDIKLPGGLKNYQQLGFHRTVTSKELNINDKLFVGAAVSYQINKNNNLTFSGKYQKKNSNINIGYNYKLK